MLLDLSIAPSKFWPSRSDFAYQHMNATPINTMKSMTYPKWQSHMQALICQALSGYRSILLTHSYYSLHSNTRIGCLEVQWVSIKCMTFPVQRGSSWAMVVMLSMFVSLFEQCEANTMNKPQRSAGRGWRSMSPPWGKHLQESPPVSVLWYWLFPCHTKKNANLHIL